jgi:sterol desaturase/sphingolipid hydroxylase (fatty acid hydroxylase superfamily)
MRNLTLGLLCSSVVQTLEKPLCEAMTQRVARQRQGLVQQLPLPSWARDAAAFLLLDYTMYLWHVLTHKVPLLWRLHLVHHVDIRLTTSTALRFHMADMVMSLPWRAAQVRLIGASPRAFMAWQNFFFVSVLFHHSNLRLSKRVETMLELLLTTPRMHGIHHQAERSRSDSNWSSGISWWDRLHGTYRMDVAPTDVRIGVPAHSEPLHIEELLCLPFQQQPDAWQPPARS